VILDLGGAVNSRRGERVTETAKSRDGKRGGKLIGVQLRSKEDKLSCLGGGGVLARWAALGVRGEEGGGEQGGV